MEVRDAEAQRHADLLVRCRCSSPHGVFPSDDCQAVPRHGVPCRWVVVPAHHQNDGKGVNWTDPSTVASDHILSRLAIGKVPVREEITFRDAVVAVLEADDKCSIRASISMESRVFFSMLRAAE